MLGLNLSISLSSGALFGGGGGGFVDPAPDFLVNYRMDGTDVNVTDVGGVDYRKGKECPDAIGKMHDGATTYATAVPDSSIWGTIGGGAFSISIWFNSANLGAVRGMIATGNGGSSGIADTIRLRMTSTGAPSLRINNTTIIGTTNLDDGTDHHFAVVCQGSGLGYQFYIDGVASNSGTLPVYNIVDSGVFDVGSQEGGTQPFNGLLDGIRIYGKALTPTEATGLFNYTCDFNPSQITTQSWYDATDVNSITGSSLVSQWDDKSSNGNHVSQGTGSNQPTTDLISLNGLNTIDFDGSNDFLKYSGAIGLASPTPAFTIITVAEKRGIGSSTNCIVSFGSETNPTSGKMASYHLGDTSIRYNNGFARFDDSGFTNPNPALIAFGSSAVGTYVTGKFSRLNGTAQSLVESSIESEPYALDDEHFMLGARVSSTGGQSAHLDGYIGEVVMIPTDDLATIQKLEGYLAWKWGLVANLDAGHPYKTEPPKEA